MQTENSGSSQNKKEEDTKKTSAGDSRIGADLGGNEYTAAFILYCQKTLDNFRRVYTSDVDGSFGPGFGSLASAGLTSNSTASPSSKMGSGPQKDKFELPPDYQPHSSDDEENEALKELSNQFEQLLNARTQLDDDDLDLDDDDKADSDDEERKALRELSKQFEQMLRANPEFEEDDLDLDEDNEIEGESDNEKESLEEFFEQFEKMFESKDEDKDNNLKSDKDIDGINDEKGSIEKFFEQFEQMLKSEAQAGNEPSELEQAAESQSNSYKGKEALKELLGQFEQMLSNDPNSNSDDVALEQYDRSQSNGHKEDEGLKEFFEQSEQIQKNPRGSEASSRRVSGPEAHREEKNQSNITEPSTQPSKNRPNEAEVDEALSGVGEVVKSAKENLGIVEIFWEESEAERAMLLAKTGITQEDFEQIVTRTGAHLYDVKDCLEGWGDLSMLPEIYEQLLLANNELTGIFEKMYGKSMLEALSKRNEDEDEDDDDWYFDDEDEDDEDDEDDWELDNK